MIGADGQVADGQIVVTLGQLVLVEDDLLGVVGTGGHAVVGPLGSGGGRPPAVDGVAAPLQRAHVVGPRPLSGRHGHVGLLDAGHHLLVEGLLTFLGRSHGALRVGVLGLEVGDDGRVVLVPQPVPVVDPHIAVGREHDRPALGCRWVERPGARRGAGTRHRSTMARTRLPTVAVPCRLVPTRQGARSDRREGRSAPIDGPTSGPGRPARPRRIAPGPRLLLSG